MVRAGQERWDKAAITWSTPCVPSPRISTRIAHWRTCWRNSVGPTKPTATRRRDAPGDGTHRGADRIGRALSGQRPSEQALAAFRRALHLDPGNTAAPRGARPRRRCSTARRPLVAGLGKRSVRSQWASHGAVAASPPGRVESAWYTPIGPSCIQCGFVPTVRIVFGGAPPCGM